MQNEFFDFKPSFKVQRRTFYLGSCSPSIPIKAENGISK